ncbi:MAG: hypothetical protein JJ992_07235, partial [Planctomycetes bacterium]|nr:hypothetical protein [Planctomycetota bacterium]
TRNVRRAMFTFLKQAIREDLVVVYFSGHGASDPDRPKNLYMLTYDTDPADNAEDDKGGQRSRNRGSNGRNQEQDGRQEQHVPTAETVAHHPGQRRA